MVEEFLIHFHVLAAGVWLGAMITDIILVFRVLENSAPGHPSISLFRHIIGILTALIGIDLARRVGFPPWTHLSAILVLIMIILDAFMFRSSRRTAAEGMSVVRGRLAKVSPIWLILYFLTLTLMLTQPF